MKKIDGIYLQIRTTLSKPENKQRIAWSAVIVTIFGIIFSILINMFPYKTAKAAADWQATGTKQSGTGALTVAWPTHQTDDVALLFIESENQNISLSTANGFVEVTNSPIGTGTAAAANATRLAVYWARATSSSMASPVVADSGDHTFAVIVTFRGVITTGDPIDITANSVTTPANTSSTFPTVSASTTDDVIVLAAAVDLDANNTNVWSGFTNSSLTNLGERFDQTINTGDGGGLGIATGQFTGSGSTGTTSGDHTSSITTQMTIALKSAPPKITVGTSGTQASAILIPSTNQYIGGAFTFIRDTGSANVTAIMVSETDATLSANSYLSNVKLYYKQEASCSGSIPGDATTFNTTGVGFNVSEKTTVTGTMTVGTSQICVYVQLDVNSGAPNGDTLDIEISSPSAEVTASAGLVSPETAVAISGSTQINLAPAVKQDHYRFRNDNGPQGNLPQALYFNPIGNGYGSIDFSPVLGCTTGNEWSCVNDDTTDTSSLEPTSDLETSELLLAAATDYYTLADDQLLAGSTITQLDIYVAGVDDVGNPNTSVTLGYCIVGGANDCGTSDTMGSAQAINGADQTKTEQFTGLSLSTTDLNNMQLVVTGSGVKAQISTLYVKITYSVSEATWAQNEDTPHTGLNKNTNIRLRFHVDNSGGDASNYNYRLEWAQQGADSSCDNSYSQENYYAVPDSPTIEHFDMTLSDAPGYIDGETTTAKLSNGESYTFVAGTTVESTSNQSAAITLSQSQYTEIEYVFQANSNATDEGIYCFRVTNAGTTLNSADAIAQVTLSSGATNTNPDTPTNLGPAGYIDAAGWMNDNTPTFSFDITDPDTADQVKYRIQIDDTAGFGSVVLDYQPSSFGAEGTYNYTVGQAGSYAVGSQSMTLSDSSVGGGYYWQVKAIDDDLAESAYEEAGVNSTVDFRVDATAPTGGSVTDSANTGLLTQLDATLSGFNADTSGLNKYEYAIGTTAGGTDTKTWTDNGTSTTITATGLILQTSVTYYFTVRATDNATNVGTAVNSAGQLVLPTLSFTLGSTSVNFNNLNAGNSYTDTKNHSLGVTTNAANGYTIYGYTTQILTSLQYPSKNIANYAGTWAVPTTWSGYGFGYTSSDSSVQGSDRFGSGTKYAGFTQTLPGDITADHTAAINGTTGEANDSWTITYKVAATTSQEASTYQTTAIYIVVPNF